MAACPKCSKKIKVRTILFALCPIWITCPSCTTKLTGNMLVEVLAFVVLIFSFVCGAGLVSLWEHYHLSLPAGTLLMVGSVFSIVLPNVYLAYRYGHFRIRD